MWSYWAVLREFCGGRDDEFRSSSKRQALGVVFLLGMGVALVQAEYGGRVAAATADELRAATGGVSMIEIGPYSSGSNFGCKDNGSSSPTAYVYEDNQCWTFTWSGLDPVDSPCSHVFHEHDGGPNGDPRVYYNGGIGPEKDFSPLNNPASPCPPAGW